ncbi:MAG: hypothetical protein PHC88_02715 [Terrimicrobiaceae bacterium]|nr:hypothetical protein [Terrimicrobiaceae bacterium]
MKRLFIPLLAVLIVATLRAGPPAATPTPAADDASEAQTRSAALELAGAFSNDGYKIRDGYYFGTLEPKKSAVIEVNLFAGDEYWFCAAGASPARKLTVRVYDENGRPVEQQSYGDGASAAAGVVASASGKYLVKVTLAEGETSPFTFLYCYK